MNRKKKSALTILAVASLTGLAFGIIEPSIAHAGTNGQQINFCANGSDYSHVAFNGYNQNGVYQELGDSVNLHPGECKTVSGWYFVGDVTIYWQNSESGKFGDQKTDCLIPRQYSEDSYTCMPKALM